MASQGVKIGRGIGLAGFGIGVVLLLYNVWSMRSSSAELVVWISAAVALAVGSLLTGFFESKLKDDAGPLQTAAMYAGTALGLALFLWLTAVLPSASDGGKRATEFFAAIEADDLDAAYEMLSKETQAKVPRDQFAQHLPDNYRAQTGSSVNGIAGGIGTVAGDTTCVDGWLEVPNGMSTRYAIGMVEDEEGILRVSTIDIGRCRTP